MAAVSPPSDVAVERFPREKGTVLAYSTLGNASAPRTLVCHSGGPGMSADYFGDMCGLGTERLRVVLLHPRGTGASSKPGTGRYELEDYAADLNALRRHLGLERIDLLGHSHGGFVSMVYALTYPGGLNRLVLACSMPRFGPELQEEMQAAIAAHADKPWYEDALEAKRRRQAWDFADAEEAAALYAREIRLWFAHDGPATEAFRREFHSQRPNLDALRYFNERLAPTYDMRPRLGEIRPPTLILNGARDHFGPEVSARELSAIPDSRVVMLPDAGPWPFAEAPGSCRAEVEAFLELGDPPA